MFKHQLARLSRPRFKLNTDPNGILKCTILEIWNYIFSLFNMTMLCNIIDHRESINLWDSIQAAPSDTGMQYEGTLKQVQVNRFVTCLLHSCMPAGCLHACLPTCLPTSLLPSFLPACLPAFLPARLNACQPYHTEQNFDSISLSICWDGKLSH